MMVDVDTAYAALYEAWYESLGFDDTTDDSMIRQHAADHIATQSGDDLVFPNPVVGACLIVLASRVSRV